MKSSPGPVWPLLSQRCKQSRCPGRIRDEWHLGDIGNHVTVYVTYDCKVRHLPCRYDVSLFTLYAKPEPQTNRRVVANTAYCMCQILRFCCNLCHLCRCFETQMAQGRVRDADKLFEITRWAQPATASGMGVRRWHQVSNA